MTDAGLVELKEFKYLKTLGLRKTAVGDEGLKELRELKSLRSLAVGNSKVTKNGMKDLKLYLPMCAINP